jgi:hypothetical protein
VGSPCSQTPRWCASQAARRRRAAQKGGNNAGRSSARFHLLRTLGGQEIRIDVDCTPVNADDDEMPEGA